ncbi:hypothetical protein IJG29_02085 [Candidatus Saccharibacteria bacterium]|nr:hypothetical protein [Candidatus Saccharibacteria bacterium]
MAQAAKKKKATSAHRKVQSSTTRSRKNVKRTVNKTTEKNSTSKKQPTKVEKIIAQERKAPAKQAASTEQPEATVSEAAVKQDSTTEQASITGQASTTEQAAEQVSVAVSTDTDATTETDVAKQDSTQSTTEPEQPITSQEVEKIIPAPVINNKSPEIILHNNKRVDLLEAKIEQAAEKITVNTKKETVVEPIRRDTITEEIRQNEKSVEDALQEVIERQEEVAVKATTKSPKKKSSRDIKESAIEKALVEASGDHSRQNRERKASRRTHFGFRRVLLALACAAAAVFAIVYFVNLNTPNVSLKVAAMQSGIDAKYPGYVPRDYNLSDITSESGKITLNFRNPSTGDAFTLIEEKSSWDSSALLNNFVRSNYGEDFSQVEEQGLTLFINGSDACWVNGGVVYKLRTTAGSLTKKQIKTIATSL